MRRNGSSSWLVDQWKQRGLIDHTPSDAEMDGFMQASFFWRRNKSRPSKVIAAPDSSWLARRNKKKSHLLTAEQARPCDRVESWSESIALSLQGRLPKPPQAMQLNRGPGRTSRKREAAAEERALVYLTLYDLSPCWNALNHHLGMGLYHSGIELTSQSHAEGTEFTYDHHAGSASGVAWHSPYYTEAAHRADLPLRDRRLLGTSSMGVKEAARLLRSLAPSWLSSQYDLLDRNCHHWSDTAAVALGVCAIPRWVDRTARCLGYMRGVQEPDGRDEPDGDGRSNHLDAVDERGSHGFCSMSSGYLRKTPVQSESDGECEPLMSAAQPNGTESASVRAPNAHGTVAARSPRYSV